MSSTAIDQLLQITTPSSLSRSSHSADADGKPFRAHLDRATDISDVKPAAEKNHAKPVRDDEAESAEANSYEEETTSNERDNSATKTESTQANGDSKEEAPLTDQPADEVTLSGVVDTQEQTIEAEIEQTLSTEVIVGTSPHGEQEQQASQTSAQLAQELTDPDHLSADVQLNATLTTSAGDPAQRDNTKQQREFSEGASSTQRSPESSPTTDALPGKPLNQTQSASGQPTSQQQPILEDSDDNGENEHSRQSTQREFSVPKPTAASDLKAATDLDLALNSSHANSTPAENPSLPPLNPAGSENVANVARSLGSSLASTAAESTGSNTESPSNETSSIDRSRFVQRIGGAIRSAQLRDGQIQLRLSPPELGTLRIQLTVNEGAVTAHLETDNAAARNVLLDNLPALRERLAEQEIRIEKFDVDVGRDDQQPADQSETTERQANDGHTPSDETTERRNTKRADSAPEVSLSVPTVANGLDVRI